MVVGEECSLWRLCDWECSMHMHVYRCFLRLQAGPRQAT